MKNPRILTDRFDRALLYAVHVHGGQVRKGTDIPYISHLLAVSALVIEHGGDEDQAIAGLLHDAAEDQGGELRLADIISRFGESVGDIVRDCTDAWVEPKPPWRKRKKEYIAHLPNKPSRSLLVSLADKTHNATAIAMDLRRIGADLWPRFNGDRKGTIWYYTKLAKVFRRELPCVLSDQLHDVVSVFERY
jgi:(p)ppGpp synthase/HD superfamily hydrolase